MKVLYDILGDVIARRPGDFTEKLTPWLLVILGGLMVLLMVYAFLSAPATI